jgi:hypothetical protein
VLPLSMKWTKHQRRHIRPSTPLHTLRTAPGRQCAIIIQVTGCVTGSMARIDLARYTMLCQCCDRLLPGSRHTTVCTDRCNLPHAELVLQQATKKQ